MTTSNRTQPRPHQLFDPEQLDAELLDLIGPGVESVVAAAESGDRGRLHGAERAWASAVIAALEIDMQIAGLELIDRGRQYVVAPLHEGFGDVLALLQLPLDLSWVIRDELLGLPYFGEYLRRAGHIAVEPESPRTAIRTLLESVPHVLDRGDSVVVFPQGSLLGVEVKFQPGAFQLAERYGLPVVPIVLCGSHRVWDYPFDRTIHRGQSIRMEVLEPIAASDAVSAMPAIEEEMKRRACSGPVPVRHYVPESDGLWSGYRFELDAAPQSFVADSAPLESGESR